MRKMLAVAAFGAALSVNLLAGVIVLSGDGNIIQQNVGPHEGLVNVGNQVFFENVLGAGTKVVVKSFTGYSFDWGAIVTAFYGTLPGVTAVEVDTVTAGDLNGASLFFGPTVTSYSAAESTAIVDFSAGGGTLFLTGENHDCCSTRDDALNGLLTQLGSGMRIGNVDFDPGPQHATGAHILANPLTSGVTDLSYAGSSNVLGGTPLFLSSDSTNVIIAVEGQNQTVAPEPSTIALMGLGVLALALRRSTGTRVAPHDSCPEGVSTDRNATGTRGSYSPNEVLRAP